MDKVELYRQVFTAFKELCAQGKQNCSFSSFCREHGVGNDRMSSVLKDEYQKLKTLPGYMYARDVGFICFEAYKEFKALCSEGKQPGSFHSFYTEFGITKRQMDHFMNRTQLKIYDIPGFSDTLWYRANASKVEEIPFENVIFEESGFIPTSNNNNVITITVDNHVSVSFPADTDISTIISFVNKIKREGDYVGA